MLAVRDSKFPEPDFFDAVKWSGYGPNPRTEQVAVNETETITLAATAIASPAATFAWRKNGKPIEGATDAVLRLGNLSSDDSATYTAVATNSEGSDSSNSASSPVHTH